MIQEHLWQVSASLDLTEHVWAHLTTKRPPRAFASLDLPGHTHYTEPKSVLSYAIYQLITDILMIKEFCNLTGHNQSCSHQNNSSSLRR